MEIGKQPAILIIAHDPGCDIAVTGTCGGDCEPVRKVLTSNPQQSWPVRPVPIHWERKLEQLREGLGQRRKGERQL